jgi:thiol-disulfide isomerase/thioredoxin
MTKKQQPKVLPPPFKRLKDSKIIPQEGLVVYLMKGCGACDHLLPNLKRLSKEIKLKKMNSIKMSYHVTYSGENQVLPSVVESFPSIFLNGKRRQNLPKLACRLE